MICSISPFACESQFKAAATDITLSWHSCKTIGKRAIDSPRYVVVACECCCRAWSLACTHDIGVLLQTIVLAACRQSSHRLRNITTPAAMCLAAVPITSCISCIKGSNHEQSGAHKLHA